MFQAPKKYQNKWSLVMDKTDKHWSRQIRKDFYVKSRDGKQYANIEVNAFIYSDEKFRLSIQSFINSSGSKDLERIPTIDRKKYDEFANRKLIQWKEKVD